MAAFTRELPFIQDKQILRSVVGVEQNRSAQLTTSMISRDTEGKRIVKAGSFVAKKANGTFRILPRVKVATYVSTGSPLIQGTAYPYVFVAGDVLTVQGTFATFDVAGLTAGTLEYKGRTVSVTPTGAGNTGAATTLFASGFAATFLGNFFYFVADVTNSILYVFSKSGNLVEDITGDGTILQGTVGDATDPQTLAYKDTTIGTVSYVDEATGNIVLTGNAAFAVPTGVPIGVTIQEVYGLLNNSYALTTERPNYDVGLISKAQVFLSGLPYYDDTIKTDLPDIDVRNVA
jgi:hypothetical protein